MVQVKRSACFLCQQTRTLSLLAVVVRGKSRVVKILCKVTN